MVRSRRLRLRLSRPPPSMAPPPPPAELIDDAIAEILLRLPPDDPACLARASLVCKLWHRILSDPTFPHRYREFHRAPPFLGFLCGFYSSGEEDTSNARRFVPTITTRIPFLQPAFGSRTLDCRHGRVLFDNVDGKRESLAVWDPVTGDHKLLSNPHLNKSSCDSAMVLCAVADCNHRGCHGGPFSVVFVRAPLYNEYKDNGNNNKAVSAWVYSSNRESESSSSGEWSAPTSVQLPKDSHIYRKRGALVGDQIYFLLTDHKILKYDMGKHCLTTIGLPSPYIYTNSHPGMLMTIEEGSSLGFAVTKDSELHLWVRNKVDLYDGSMGWVQDRVVSLNNLVPVIPYGYTYGHVNVTGFAEGVDILLLGEEGSGYMFELKSGQFKKIPNPEYHYYGVYPYLSFYIPDFASHKSPLPVEAK